jgi:hypothetical protein
MIQLIKMAKSGIIPITILFSLALTSCSDDDNCNDCLEIRNLQVRYIDEAGNNILFGENAISNPEDVIVWDITNQPINYGINNDLETISIPLLQSNEYIEIQPVDSVVNVIEVDLVLGEGTQCCNTLIPSTITVDSVQVPNASIIEIVLD